MYQRERGLHRCKPRSLFLHPKIVLNPLSDCKDNEPLQDFQIIHPKSLFCDSNRGGSWGLSQMNE